MQLDHGVELLLRRPHNYNKTKIKLFWRRPSNRDAKTIILFMCYCSCADVFTPNFIPLILFIDPEQSDLADRER